MIVSLQGLPGAAMWREMGSREAAGRSLRFDVPADQVLKDRIYVVAPASGGTREEFMFKLRTTDNDREQAQDDESFVRPEEAR